MAEHRIDTFDALPSGDGTPRSRWARSCGYSGEGPTADVDFGSSLHIGGKQLLAAVKRSPNPEVRALLLPAASSERTSS